jgi:TRAP-type uncharacterized transport system fused permease subunit
VCHGHIRHFHHDGENSEKTLTISPWRKSKFFRQVANGNNTPTFLHYMIILTLGYFLVHAAVSTYFTLRFHARCAQSILQVQTLFVMNATFTTDNVPPCVARSVLVKYSVRDARRNDAQPRTA